MSIRTLALYMEQCRILLQDTTAAPRYTDNELKKAMSVAFDEAFRIRPDMFIGVPAPFVVGQLDEWEPPIPRGYDMAFIMFVVGYTQLRDAEDVTDARAAGFLTKFVGELTQTAS